MALRRRLISPRSRRGEIASMPTHEAGSGRARYIQRHLTVRTIQIGFRLIARQRFLADEVQHERLLRTPASTLGSNQCLSACPLWSWRSLVFAGAKQRVV